MIDHPDLRRRVGRNVRILLAMLAGGAVVGFVAGNQASHLIDPWLASIATSSPTGDRLAALALGVIALATALFCPVLALFPSLSASVYRLDVVDDRANIERIARILWLSVPSMALAGVAFTALGVSNRPGDDAALVALLAAAGAVVVTLVIARRYWALSDELERQSMRVGNGWALGALVAALLIWTTLSAMGLVPAPGAIWPAVLGVIAFIAAHTLAYLRLGGFD